MVLLHIVVEVIIANALNDVRLWAVPAKTMFCNAPKIGDAKVYTIGINDKDRNFYSDQFLC